MKCLSHTSKSSENAPGHITIVVVPKVMNRSGVNTLAPKPPGKTLTEIKHYLERYVSLRVTIDVINPNYQVILVDLRVGFIDCFDEGYYLQQLNTDIREFLSPLIIDSSTDIVFGVMIYKSSIVDFVERREYVDYITDFKFFFRDESDGIGRMILIGAPNRPENQIDFQVFSDSEVAEPQDARSILISSTEHNINISDGTSSN